MARVTESTATRPRMPGSVVDFSRTGAVGADDIVKGAFPVRASGKRVGWGGERGCRWAGVGSALGMGGGALRRRAP
ncbi:hypothetical protein MANAM107_26020 [Actinomyces capricornis]|uniref:Uncharacterized protein n=1 Tax=Actinomyces capricornis TaxID=2755559 RepID=A0ABM7UFC9_9ACTO|nr:hypothetical protein MANAM107_26020 [Actinomyces capricornis]